MRATKFIAVAAFALATGTACESASTTAALDTNNAFFNATITGGIQQSFQSDSRFHVGVDARINGNPLTFSLTSQGRGGQSGVAFQMYRAGAGAPAPGRYALGLDVDGFRATYDRIDTAGVLEAYAAESGEVVITTSTASRIEGTFRFSGYRYCGRAGVLPVGPCVIGTFAIAGAPRIEVSGSFAAVPARSDSLQLQLIRGTIGFYSDPIRITVPQSAERGTPFTVSVTTYGDGCVSKGRTDVQVNGLSVGVQPYDYHAIGGVCTQQLVTIEHRATIVIQERGTATVVFKGRRAPQDDVLTIERRVEVR